MSLLEVSQLKFNYGDGELFNNASFRLFKEDHIGLVGVNGSGKTTFMNLIAKNIKPDAGSIEWMPKVTVGYLDQHAKLDKKMTSRTYLFSVFEEDFKKEEEMENLYHSMAYAEEKDYDRILTKADAISQYLIEKDFYAFKSKIGNVISGLGILEESLDKPMGQLSGGMRAKIILAKLLLESPDVLLMDEPTNFLDVEHIAWLTKFLVSYPSAFIVISHNTSFLRDISNVVVALENKTLTRYKGNYDFFLKENQLRKEHYEKAFENQQKFIEKTEDFIKKNIVRASSTKQAQSRRKMLEKIEVLDKPTKDKKIKIHFPFSSHHGTEVLRVKDLLIGYDKPLLKPITFDVLRGQKVVISGMNGIGKSTLIKTLIEEIPRLGGNFKYSDNQHVAYFAQEKELDLNLTPIQTIHAEYPTFEEVKIRQALSNCGVTKDLVAKPLKTLSGGERTKVRICLLTLRKSNFLIMDEPTNHLDLNTKKSLYQALASYPGTVLLVSHEKDFYNELRDIEIKL